MLPAAPSFAQSNATPTLYKQLGGYDAIAAVTDDFMVRLTSDPKLVKFFAGASDKDKARIRQMLVDLICAKTGGPCVYVGADLGESHKGLGITSAEFDASAGDLKASLDHFKVPANLQQQLLAIVASTKSAIVTK